MDVYQALAQKVVDLERVRKEIAALHLAIPLLVEEADWAENGCFPKSPRSLQEREPQAS
jgi:hypothetical protein